MTDAEVAELRERLAKATPGPWEVWHSGTNEVGEATVGMCWDAVHRYYERDSSILLEADANFIAHAPEDIAALLKDREALQAREKRLVEALRLALPYVMYGGQFGMSLGDGLAASEVMARGRAALAAVKEGSDG